MYRPRTHYGFKLHAWDGRKTFYASAARCRRESKSKNPMNCPSCASEQTQKFSAIYEAGTSTVESTSSGGGVAFTQGGLTPVLTASSSTGTQQTQLAARAAPPGRKPVGGSIIAAILLSPILAVIAGFAVGVISGMAGAETATASTAAEVAFWVVLAVMSIGFIAMAVGEYKFNRDELPLFLDFWSKKWLCHRCGADFVGSTQIGSASTLPTAADGLAVPQP